MVLVRKSSLALSLSLYCVDKFLLTGFIPSELCVFLLGGVFVCYFQFIINVSFLFVLFSLLHCFICICAAWAIFYFHQSYAFACFQFGRWMICVHWKFFSNAFSGSLASILVYFFVVYFFFGSDFSSNTI